MFECFKILSIVFFLCFSGTNYYIWYLPGPRIPIYTHRGQDDMALHRGISGSAMDTTDRFKKNHEDVLGNERQNFVVETIAGPGRRLIKQWSF
jgi:hypothetical protein